MGHGASGTAVLTLVYSGHMFRHFWEAIMAQLKIQKQRKSSFNSDRQNGGAANVWHHNLQAVAAV
jgi:hypothetical protein